MSAYAAPLTGLSELALFDVLWAREKLGTTGVGHGIAIPHGRIEGIEKVQGFFIRLSNAVDFEALDQRPVDLVFVLLAPADAGADHLNALGKVSSVLRDQALCERLRRAKNAEEIYHLLTDEPHAKAA